MSLARCRGPDGSNIDNTPRVKYAGGYARMRRVIIGQREKFQRKRVTAFSALCGIQRLHLLELSTMGYARKTTRRDRAARRTLKTIYRRGVSNELDQNQQKISIEETEVAKQSARIALHFETNKRNAETQRLP